MFFYLRSRLNANYYLVFLYRLFIALLLLTLCRFLFYWLNTGLFPHVGLADWPLIMKGGFRFDLAALLYFNALPIFMMMLPLPYGFRAGVLYEKIVRVVFFICNGLALLLSCIDFIYYRFTLRRTTVAVFKEFQHETNGSKLVQNFIVDYWYVTLLFCLLILLMVWLYRRLQPKAQISQKPIPYYITTVAALCLCIFLSVGGIRGDFKHSTRPITISNAGDYVKSPDDIYLVLNTPFVFVRTMNVVGLKKMNYYQEPQLSELYTPVHRPNPADSFQKKNVVLIILESFGKEALGFYNKDLDNGTYTGFTPFLDSLAGQSLVYWNGMANGRKSIDAIPSSILSIPSGLNPFVLTPYVSDSLGGLAHVLKKEGYYNAFFHGAPNGSMGFSAITKLLGIDHYYGKNEFNNDAQFDGIWGIWDEPFFGYFGDKLSTLPQPFFSTVFSVSSHHPFKVPEQYQNTFKKGPLPVLECISYTDLALRKFFDKIKQESWFKNTIFVITADHATVSYHKEYLNPWGEYAIPILLYAPGDSSMKGVRPGFIQQIDIMPTVLGYLKYNKPFVAFGNNVLDTANSAKKFVFQYSGGYRWYQGDYALFYDENKITGLYNYKTDTGFTHNIMNSDKAVGDSLAQRLRAFIQQYNNRLLENRLTAK